MNDGTSEFSNSTNQAIKFAAESLTVLAIASYAIGFIIVNSYLLTFGYSSNALFKTTYIGAGILFFLIATPIALSMYSFILNGQWAKDTSQDSSAKRQRLNFVSIGILAFATYYLLNHVASYELRSTSEESLTWVNYLIVVILAISILFLILENVTRKWTLAVWAKRYSGLSYLILYLTVFVSSFKIEVVFCIAILALAIWLAMKLFFEEQSVLTRLRNWPPGLVYDLVVAISLLLGAMGLFGTTLYGNIKPQYGGGHPPRVRVLIAEEKKDVLDPLVAPGNMKSMLADTQLIDSTEKELLLLLKSTYDDKGVLLQVDRSIVHAVVYLPSSP